VGLYWRIERARERGCGGFGGESGTASFYRLDASFEELGNLFLFFFWFREVNRYVVVICEFLLGTRPMDVFVFISSFEVMPIVNCD
jgi:hypothetical protein